MYRPEGGETVGYDEIGRVLEIDEKTVKSRLFEARKRLRSLITRQVERGVAIRMACLDVLTRRARRVEGWS